MLSNRRFFIPCIVLCPAMCFFFEPETQTASIQPAVQLGSVAYPVLTDVPVFMPVPFSINHGDACLVVFSDADIDNWFETGEASAPNSLRRHSLSDGFAFVGFRTAENPENTG